MSNECVNFPRLSEGQCRKIHEASLSILEGIGVRLDLKEAIDLLKRAGAEVTKDNFVRVPATLVEKALETAPKRVVLYDRNGNPVMPVEGYRCFYGPGSDCLNIIDHRTGERRSPVLKDIAEGAILCDALANIDFVMSMFVPSDVGVNIADRFQMEKMLTHTTKPIFYVAYDLSGCIDAVKMAEAVAGGEEALRKKPMAACYINAISGLLHNKEALEKLIYLASKNLPSMYLPTSTAGITSPITPAGNVAQDYAGILVGLVLSQLTREGAPVIVSGMPPGGTFDMRTMVTSYAEPERTIIQAMGHFYHLPMFSLAGVSEAKIPDQQAAAEAALTLMAETLAGGNIIHDLGYLESGLTFSLAQLVLCDEIVSWIRAFTKDFEVNEETIALDVIEKAGHFGQYLSTDHTLKHYRERWYPSIFERGNYMAWKDSGAKSLTERASEKIDRVLKNHSPEALPDEIRKTLRQITLKAQS